MSASRTSSEDVSSVTTLATQPVERSSSSENVRESSTRKLSTIHTAQAESPPALSNEPSAEGNHLRLAEKVAIAVSIVSLLLAFGALFVGRKWWTTRKHAHLALSNPGLETFELRAGQPNK